MGAITNEYHEKRGLFNNDGQQRQLDCESVATVVDMNLTLSTFTILGNNEVKSILYWKGVR